MNIEDMNNKIIIIKDEYKNSILNKLRLSCKLINTKIFTLSELKRKFFFDYSEECIYYVAKKYDILYETAKIYMDNLYYINGKTGEDKVDFLYDLKLDLLDKDLLITNELFKEYSKNKEIILYNLNNIDKFYDSIFSYIKENNNVSEIHDKLTFSKKILYELNDEEEQISFVASKICELIDNGIDINKIKLAGVSESDYFIIKKVFKLFNIPINLESKYSIYSTNIANKFISMFSSDLNSVFDTLKKMIKTKSDEEIYNKLINIVNKYTFVEDYLDVKDMIINDIASSYIKIYKYKNAVNLIDVNTLPLEDEYVFLINFNEGVVPVNIKDEDFLNDKIKDSLKISTSTHLNEIASENIKDFIKYSKNLIVCYIKYSSGSEIYKSSVYSPEILDIQKGVISYNHSHKYNQLKLVSMLDDNKKYGTVSDELIALNSKYNIDYESYDNTYKKINKKDLYDYLGNKLSLSYTSVNDYYKCSFRYYLDYILKLNKYEDTFDKNIGNVYHKILSECFVDNYNFDKRFDEEIALLKYEFNMQEKFFLKKLKKELLNVINSIKEQLKYTRLSKSMYEKEIIIEIDKSLHITFKGVVDKMLYDNINGENIVMIIDYKTGNPKLNLNYVKYGLNMQLPVYSYLIKNFKELDNVRIGGFYLQKILNSPSLDEDEFSLLKLQGYSNSDTDILKYVDSEYENSKIIKSLKTTSNGFYSYSKIISDEDIDKLSSIVHEKINEASNGILSADFDINPKEINGNLLGCEYCKYKDICYMKHKDITILGGDNLEQVDE